MLVRETPITRTALVSALETCGLERGDVVLVHSDMFLMGPVEGQQADHLPTYYRAFWEVLGAEGTLVVPAFFYEYGRSQMPYDISRSPVSSELGAFARYVAGQPEAQRSPNPITALAAVGARADYICGGGTGSAFGVDSPWDRLLQTDGKMVFMGIDLRPMTFIHFVEYVVGVPHMYNKIYPIPITDNGHPVDLRICSQVRYLDFGIEHDTPGLTAKFEQAGLLRTTSVGRGVLRCVGTRAAFDFLKEKLKRDFYYLLKRPPAFEQGRIPMDGPAGPARP